MILIDFITAGYTDAGIRKHINQDSMLLMKAGTACGNVLLAAVCDGMGGLEEGEAASAALVRSLAGWFSGEFPGILYGGLKPDVMQKSLERLICTANRRIRNYGRGKGIRLGTTCAAFLAAAGQYCIMNIGDSRVYLLNDHIEQLTKDQTLAQQEEDLGRITQEQARKSPKRNILLQCVGANPSVKPDFFCGKTGHGSCYLLCSDGLARRLTPEEIHERLNPSAVTSGQYISDNLRHLTELAKARNEKDNISALLIKII